MNELSLLTVKFENILDKDRGKAKWIKLMEEL
jgi:hypothetical protein